MNLLYQLGIRLYGLGMHIAALFNSKAAAWVRGRKGWRKEVLDNVPATGRFLWVHAASLGEMEQGIPIIQELREKYPQHKILVTFFSPSGYKNFQNDNLADYVMYLPLDTKRNAQEFLSLFSPELAFFVKYDIWVNFFRQIQLMEIPLILAPASFRSDQIYFKKPWRSFFLPVLKRVDKILVQNSHIEQLLLEHQFNNVAICGDTRFERAIEVTKTHFISPKIEEFCEDYLIVVGGSSWPPEEDILEKMLHRYPESKIILAPHDVSEANIERLLKKFRKQGAVLYSEKSQNSYRNNWVMIIDTMGMLKKIYRYGHLAFVGGGFGKGIHSLVEPAAYKIPVAFGPKHHKFPEAAEMIEHEVGFEINQVRDLEKIVRDLDLHPSNRAAVARKCDDYLQTKVGSTKRIIEAVEPFIIT